MALQLSSTGIPSIGLLQMVALTELLFPTIASVEIVWDIVRINQLDRVLFIDDDSDVPGGIQHIRWSCGHVPDDLSILLPLPPLLTVIINCPHHYPFDIMNMTLFSLSLGRRGLLTRPVLNWIMTNGHEDKHIVETLMTKADTVLWLGPERHCVDSWDKWMKITKCLKLQNGTSVYSVVKVPGDAPSHGLFGLVDNTFVGFRGESIVVGCRQYRPFAYQRPIRIGSWMGYAVEITKQLAVTFDMRAKYVRSKDNRYGGKRPDGSWNGLIGMVLEQEIDLAATGLTASTEREEVVDFLYPFYLDQFGMLLQIKEDNWLSFYKPLKKEVWLAYIGAALLVALSTRIFILVARNFTFSDPSSNQKFDNTGHAEFFFGALVNQGGIYNPSECGVRMLVSFFWILVVVVSATYCANLTASLATQQVKLPFNTIEEIANQDEYQLFFPKGSAQEAFIQNSVSQDMQKLAKKYKRNPDLFHRRSGLTSTEQIESGKFVYISDMVDMRRRSARRKDCSFFSPSEGFGSSPMAIALPKHSPFEKMFSKKVTDMLEVGLDVLWFRQHWIEDVCSGRLKTSATATPMTLQQATGPFILLGGGVIVGLLSLSFEFLLNCSCMFKRMS